MVLFERGKKFKDEMRGGVSVEDVGSHNLDWKNKSGKIVHLLFMFELCSYILQYTRKWRVIISGKKNRYILFIVLSTKKISYFSRY